VKDAKPAILWRATVHKNANSLICPGHGMIKQKALEKYSMFSAYLKGQQHDQWCLEYIMGTDISLGIALAIQN
jgi:flavorubredoxin